MSSRRIDVTEKSGAFELPKWLNGYVIGMELLKEAGIWEEVPEKLRINRQGYQGIDVAMVLLAHRCCRRDWGLKRFLEETSEYGKQLAAVAGRERWPTQSAMSRALSHVDPEEVEEFGEWMLEQTARQGVELLRHSGACWRDSDGEGRRVFHADGTVHAMRRRGLPEGEELPAPRRFVAGLGEPGFSGRKRGEVQYKATLAQETGTGLWVGARLSSGGGSFSEEVSALTESAERWVQLLGETDRRATMVTDGDAGGIGQSQVGVNSELGFGTRLSCYELLDEPQLREHLNEGMWRPVEDSKSGPSRWAMEGGTIRLRDVRLRIVVSRYAVGEDSKTGPGKVIDGWRYELFGFEAGSSEELSAAEAVTLYYGRNAEENRFAARHREFGSPEVVSFAPGGQYLGVVMALVAWNLETILGSKAEMPLEEVGKEPEVREAPAQKLPGLPDNSQSEEGEEGPGTCAAQVPFEELLELIEDYDWENRLEEGWRYHAPTNEVICPQGQRLGFGDTRAVAGDQVEVRYRNSYSACSNCPVREECSRSEQERFRRELTIRVAVEPDDYETPVGRYEWKPPSSTEACSSEDEKTRQQPPQLVPAAFRRRYRMLTQELTVEIRVDSEKPDDLCPDYLAEDAAARQRRRHSWEERLSWNEFDGETTVEIEVPRPSIATRIKRILAPQPPPEETHADSA